MPYMVPVSACLYYQHCYRPEMGSEQSSAAKREEGAANAAQVSIHTWLVSLLPTILV